MAYRKGKKRFSSRRGTKRKGKKSSKKRLGTYKMSRLGIRL